MHNYHDGLTRCVGEDAPGHDTQSLGGSSKIEWTNKTWNPVSGCSHVSEGCRNCYAERIFPRVYGNDMETVPTPADGIVPEDYIQPKEVTGHWKRRRKFTDVQCHPERLDRPLHWRKPCKIFVNSMSDLFHEDVPYEFIDEVFLTMAKCHEDKWNSHVFQILTKRPQRMLDYLKQCEDRSPAWTRHRYICDLYLRNVWLGVSVEDQQTADERIPILLETPAAVRWVSAEPLLGPVNFEHIGDALFDRKQAMRKAMNGPMAMNEEQADHVVAYPKLDWVVVGGESGPKARPMDPDWARSIRDQCSVSGVPFFFKQWGEFIPLTAKDPQVKKAWNIIDLDGERMCLVGKRLAGRILDGREWNQMARSSE